MERSNFYSIEYIFIDERTDLSHKVEIATQRKIKEGYILISITPEYEVDPDEKYPVMAGYYLLVFRKLSRK